jgi:hypothetical protein
MRDGPQLTPTHSHINKPQSPISPKFWCPHEVRPESPDVSSSQYVHVCLVDGQHTGWGRWGL